MDKGYHSNDTLVTLQEGEYRTYVSEPERGRRNWKGKGQEKRAVYANRRRIPCVSFSAPQGVICVGYAGNCVRSGACPRGNAASSPNSPTQRKQEFYHGLLGDGYGHTGNICEEGQNDASSRSSHLFGRTMLLF